ncbi:hypothetical protein [Methylobacterium trifolii]|uniref:Uncharacterized protein n=1 Tax=Methylobacterium trifolii TaxID=1003092 RepID=A0ABQ4TVD6_9HYPH|nr:hypothetical protein [Methylobacterium trifolii]GJE59200.1 hypothetical protein MPOCJGCO_1288 [Methylobacterium trifolii]
MQTPKQILLAAMTAMLALGAAACATKPPPAPSEPTPVIRKG